MSKALSGAVAACDNMEQHELALQLVPGNMPDEEFDAFCEDLRKRGQQHKIMLYEGKVLDGMHRYRGCKRNGMTPEFHDYTGDDPAGMVIALNVLRRKLGCIQRALAGAHLNIDFGISQDEASKRVGVSKLDINYVAQALRSKNTRIIKMLENPNLTRAQLYEELVDSGTITASTRPVPSHTATGKGNLSSAGATSGLDMLFANRDGEVDNDESFGEEDAEPTDDFLAGPGDEDEDSDESEDDTVALEGLLGDPPSANGKVIGLKTGVATPPSGTKPTHPERRAKDTPASLLAERFKGLPEAEQISFMQMAWPTMRKLLSPAGLNAEGTVPAAKVDAKPAPAGKPSKATSAQAAAAAQAATAVIEAAKVGKATKPKATPKATPKAKAVKAVEHAEAAGSSPRTRKPA